MPTPDRYERVTFVPDGPLGYSAVTLLDPADETRVLGTIPVAALLARPSPFDGKHAPPVEKATERAYYPSVRPLVRRKQEPVKRQRAAA